MQGMMFGGEGPVMKGTWYNPANGDVFTVRDSFFEDNNYIVATTDGRYLRYEQLQNYTQSDMPANELKAVLAQNSKKHEEEIPSEIKNLLEDSDDPYSEYMIPDDMVQPRSLGNISDTRHIAPAVAHQSAPLGNINTPVNMNTAIIEKALKNAPKPEFVVNVYWESYPSKQIEMLKDVMEIPQEEILDWYLANIDMKDVIDAIKVGISNRILGEEFVVLDTNIKELTELQYVEPVVKEAEEIITTLSTEVEPPKKTAKPKTPKSVNKPTKTKATKSTKKKS